MSHVGIFRVRTFLSLVRLGPYKSKDWHINALLCSQKQKSAMLVNVIDAHAKKRRSYIKNSKKNSIYVSFLKSIQYEFLIDKELSDMDVRLNQAYGGGYVIVHSENMGRPLVSFGSVYWIKVPLTWANCRISLLILLYTIKSIKEIHGSNSQCTYFKSLSK